MTLSLDNVILYIGTDKGLMALNTGSDIQTVLWTKSLPIPITSHAPSSPDAITIEGLKAGCIVKIINMQGNWSMRVRSLTTDWYGGHDTRMVLSVDS